MFVIVTSFYHDERNVISLGQVSRIDVDRIGDGVKELMSRLVLIFLNDGDQSFISEGFLSVVQSLRYTVREHYKQIPGPERDLVRIDRPFFQNSEQRTPGLKPPAMSVV